MDTTELLTAALRDLRVWIEHWERDRSCGLPPTALSLDAAKRRIDDVLALDVEAV